MSPDEIYRVSRYVFAFLGFFSLISALGWIHTEKKERREKLRSLPAAGIVGELLVLAGSDELPAQTWFPVTREGVLGSVRSCDLVVPCPGVKAHHLDYCWIHGVGLIVRPRSGCEVKVNGVTLDCRSDALFYPLLHGSCLEVGKAVLRLQLLKALDPTYAGRTAAPVPEPAFSVPEGGVFPAPEKLSPYNPPAAVFPEQMPQINPAYSPSEMAQPVYNVPPSDMVPQVNAAPPVYMAPPAGQFPETVAPSSPRPPRRSDRWKEDWSE